MKKTFNMLGASALLISSAAPAVLADSEKPAISYSYAELGYVHNNFNSNGARLADGEGLNAMLQEGTGTGISGVVSARLPFGAGRLGTHIVADFSKTNYNVAIGFNGTIDAAGVVDISQREASFAFGIHYALGDSTSFFAEAGIVSVKVKPGTFDVVDADLALISGSLSGAAGSKTALDVKAGIRHRFNKLEIMGYARQNGAGSIKDGPAEMIEFSSKVKAGAGVTYHFTRRLALSSDYEFSSPGKLRLKLRLNF